MIPVQFDTPLQPDLDRLLRAFGMDGTADADHATLQQAGQAADDVTKAATPKWTFAHFPLADGWRLGSTDVTLEGGNIRAHLAGCHGCFLMAVTLGQPLDRALRTREVKDMTAALWFDRAASVLAEQYAEAAWQTLKKKARPAFVTPRFSPGYGDFSLAIQPDLLRLMDTPRAIGVHATESGLMVPRKSITALVGVAHHPVQGKLADCNNCHLKEKCEPQKGCLL